MALFLRIIQHLLPDAAAWRITVAKALRRFFEGLAGFFQYPRDFIDAVLLDAFPDTTRELDRWESQFGLARAAAQPRDLLLEILRISGCVAFFDPKNATAIIVANATIANGSDLNTPGWTHTNVTPVLNQDGLGGTRFTVSTATTPAVAQNIANVGVHATQNPPCALVVRYKSGTIPFLMVETRSATAANRTWVNLSTHALGTSGANHSVSAPSAPDGDGYRTVTVTMNANGGTATFRLAFVNADNSTTSASVGQTIWLKNATVDQPRCGALKNLITGIWWGQASANAQPGYEAIGLNGQPAIRSYIPGSAAHYLQSSEASVLATFTGDDKPWTVLAAALPRHNIATESNALFSSYSSSTDNLTALLQDNGGIGPWAIYRRDGVGLETEPSTQYGGSGTPHVLEAWFTGSQASIGYDELTPSPNGATSTRGSLAPTFMRLLAYGTSSGSNMSLGALAIWPRSLTDAERESACDAIGHRFTITAAESNAVDPDIARREKLAAAWAARGGQSKTYIDGVLESFGFNAKVYDWWTSGPPYVARDPRLYTNQPSTGLEPRYIANSDLTGALQPAIPSDPTKWPFFLYVSGATFDTPVRVLARDRPLFETLILKTKPAHMYAVFRAEYLGDLTAVVKGQAIAARAFAENAICG